jgi:hypothetical protein
MLLCPFCDRIGCKHIPLLVPASGEETSEAGSDSVGEKKLPKRISVPTTNVGFGEK